MSQFSFPVLDHDDLVQCLEEMEMSVDSNQLAKPMYELVRPLLEQIVVLLTGATREEMTQPIFTCMDVFEYPELHDESISTNNFFRLLSKLMMASGVKDFSWRDVFKPEPQRLRKHLSAIINFARFRDDKATGYQEHQARVDTKVEAVASLDQEHTRNAAELRRMQALRAEQAALVSAEEAEEAALIAKNTSLNKQASQQSNELRVLKARAAELSDQTSQAKLDLATARQETETLQSQIVQSPEKHRAAIAELASAAEAKRSYCAQLASQTIDKDRQLEMVAKFEKDLARCTKLLEELDTVVAKKKEVSQQVKDTREAVASSARTLQELTNTGSTLKRHQETVMDKFQRLEAQAALKMEAAASFVEEALKGREAVEAENAAMGARAAEEEAMIRSVLERIQETVTAHETCVKNTLDKYALLHMAVTQYNKRLKDALH